MQSDEEIGSEQARDFPRSHSQAVRSWVQTPPAWLCLHALSTYPGEQERGRVQLWGIWEGFREKSALSWTSRVLRIWGAGKVWRVGKESGLQMEGEA